MGAYPMLTCDARKVDAVHGADVAVLRGCRLRPFEAVQTWLAATTITERLICRRITTRHQDGRGGGRRNWWAPRAGRAHRGAFRQTPFQSR